MIYVFEVIGLGLLLVVLGSIGASIFLRILKWILKKFNWIDFDHNDHGQAGPTNNNQL